MQVVRGHAYEGYLPPVGSPLCRCCYAAVLKIQFSIIVSTKYVPVKTFIRLRNYSDLVLPPSEVHVRVYSGRKRPKTPRPLYSGITHLYFFCCFSSQRRGGGRQFFGLIASYVSTQTARQKFRFVGIASIMARRSQIQHAIVQEKRREKKK